MSLERARVRVEALLAPLPGAAPFGSDARQDPAHEAVRSEVAKLDAPGAGAVDWQKVLKQGGDLLSARSKDWLIAAYTAQALLEAEGLLGLLAGVVLLSELLERAWDGMYPPPARAKARASALAWFVERASARLKLAPDAAADAALLDALASSVVRLAELTRGRFGDASPALEPLAAALETLRLARPGAQRPALAQAATSAEVASAASDARLPEPGAALFAEAAAQGADLRQRLLAPLASWLEPIDAAAPTGKDARYDPLHEELRALLKQLESPTGKPVEWSKVVARGETLLKQRSKDLLPAACVAYAFYQLEGLAGLAKGLALVAALVERYWDGLFPEMKRSQKARSAAVGWLLGRLGGLSERPLEAGEAAALDALAGAADWLAAALGERFDDEHRPAIQPLLQQVERLRLAQVAAPAAAPAPARKPRPAAERAAASPAQANEASAPASSLALPDAAPAPDAVANRGELNRYLSGLHTTLADAGSALRKANPRDPLAYLLPRLGAALELEEEPPSQNRTTFIAAPDPGETREIRGLAAEQNWEALLAAAEANAANNPLFLDMHRLVILALQNLGEPYAACLRVVEGELLGLLKRLPAVLELSFSNGTPFADPDTREFIKRAILAAGAAGGGGAGARAGETSAEAVAAARALAVSGKKLEALAGFEALIQASRTARERFELRLELAKAVLAGNDPQLAAGLFATLYEEIEQRGLCEWEPELAADCLQSYLQCLNRGGGGPEMAHRVPLVYARLCRVDPRRALEASR